MTTPDQIELKNICDSEMGTLERMKCWKVVWIKISHKGRVVTRGYLQERTFFFNLSQLIFSNNYTAYN